MTTVDYTKTNNDGDFDNLNSDDVIPASTGKVVGDKSKLNSSIPEATHDTPEIDLDAKNDKYMDDDPKNDLKNDQAGQHKADPFNPDFVNIPEEQVDESAEQTAEAIVYGYSELMLLIPSAIAISKRKLKKLDKEGEIDMDMLVRTNRHSNDHITMEEVVNRFNSTISEPFKTSDEFKNNVTPLLAKILKKRGMVASDENLLIFYFVEDLIGKGKAFISAAADRRDLLDTLKEIYSTSKPAATPVIPLTPDVPQQPVKQPVPPAAEEQSSAEKIQDIVAETLDKNKNKATGKKVIAKKSVAKKSIKK